MGGDIGADFFLGAQDGATEEGFGNGFGVDEGEDEGGRGVGDAVAVEDVGEGEGGAELGSVRGRCARGGREEVCTGLKGSRFRAL